MSDIMTSVKLHEVDFLKFLLRFFEILEGEETKKLVHLYRKLNLDQLKHQLKSA